jgi:hypothetical protein
VRAMEKLRAANGLRGVFPCMPPVRSGSLVPPLRYAV